jgi:hypothetical protein
MYDTIRVYQDIGILHDATRLYKTYVDDIPKLPWLSLATSSEANGTS